MKVIKHCFAIGFVFFLSLSAAVHASQLFQKGVFSISIPDGWVEIPSDVIDAFENEVARLAPNAPVQDYDYGFQLDGGDNWFEYPYILVQVNNMGRIPEGQIEELDGYSVQEGLSEHERDLSAFLSDIKAGKMYYDKDAKVIWFRFQFNAANIGPVSGLSGMIPTEEGFVQVIGYSLTSDYSSYESVFKAAAVSVTPSAEYIYKPRWSDSLPPAVGGIDWSKVAVKAMVGAIIGALVALFAGLRRKKKK